MDWNISIASWKNFKTIGLMISDLYLGTEILS